MCILDIIILIGNNSTAETMPICSCSLYARKPVNKRYQYNYKRMINNNLELALWKKGNYCELSVLGWL